MWLTYFMLWVSYLQKGLENSNEDCSGENIEIYDPLIKQLDHLLVPSYCIGYLLKPWKYSSCCVSVGESTSLKFISGTMQKVPAAILQTNEYQPPSHIHQLCYTIQTTEVISRGTCCQLIYLCRGKIFEADSFTEVNRDRLRPWNWWNRSICSTTI